AGVDVSDLRRADLNAVVMELVTEEESRRVALIEADGHDASAAAYGPDGLLQRPRRAGALEDDGDAFGPEAQLELMRNIDPLGRQHGLETERLRDRETRCDPIDDVDRRRAGRRRELRDDETDGSSAEDHGRPRAQLGAGVA